MLPNTDFDNVIRALRKTIIDYVGIDSNRVSNALTVRGADLLKIINSTELNSYNLSDSFIVFELLEDNDKEYFVMEEDEKNLCYVSYMHMDLKLYGTPCHNISRKLIATFKDEKILNELYYKGIYYKGITGPNSVNEFINNTLWPRCDMSIKVQIKTAIPKPTEEEYFNLKNEPLDIDSSLITKNI